MRRTVVTLAFLGILRPGATRVQAASLPVINVTTYGIELCPQSICGAAIFTGVLYGQVGLNPKAVGTFAVAVTHEDLPDPYETSAVTGGVFELAIGLRRIKGFVAPGGTLFNNGNNTYTVDATLVITSGGIGTLHYKGLLNHNVFPPTIIGPLTQ